MSDEEGVRLRVARVEEAEALGEVAFRSKAHWGYGAEWMERARAELQVAPEQIAQGLVIVLEEVGQVLGLYALQQAGAQVELTDLWLEPAAIGRGHGRRLLAHALAHARRLGGTELLCNADPNAEGFYRAMGGERIGQTPSTVEAGRLLPRLRFSLTP